MPSRKTNPKSSTKELHVDPCDMVIEIRNELVSFKKELRGNYWKKLGLLVTIALAIMTCVSGGCVYMMDRTSAKFDEQAVRFDKATEKDDALTERIHQQERKTDKTEMILNQLVTMQQEGRDDIRSIKEAQHRIELSIANRGTPE